MQTRNATHSIALTEIAGEHIVSCFPLDTDGEPDTDCEIFVRVFADADVARRVYTARAALLSLPARDFDRVIEWVYRCVSSLTSCLQREVPNEARILRDAVTDLQIAALARRNAGREERKVNALAHAAKTLDRRLENLDEKIASEAAKRLSLGQP